MAPMRANCKRIFVDADTHSLTKILAVADLLPPRYVEG
jgi:hypothetical protein